MSEKAKQEFPLDQLSKAETDEEFGLPDFKEHFADTITPAVLRDWTAKDFANIYVRFRPHLERHARRFLINPSQVEEVVQDAFLYLMTTLPELDSELGVLKFLKWKVRLLSLDVIRVNSRASLPLDELPDLESDQPETSRNLERAEDAAVVALALAKLQPRQREALIATIYEEKSSKVVSTQMGLSENAFRQLLYRAKKSFKLALVGEAELQGKSLAEILSVAARRAATTRTLVSGILIALCLTLPSVVVSAENSQLADMMGKTQVSKDVASEMRFGAGRGAFKSETPKSESIESSVLDTAEPSVSETRIALASASSEEPPSPNPGKSDSSNENEVLTNFDIARLAFSESLGLGLVESIANSNFQISPKISGYSARDDLGLSVDFAIDTNSQSVIQFLVVSYESNGVVWKAVPSNHLSVVERANGQVRVSFAATDFLVGDFSGTYDFVSTGDSVFSRSGVKLDLVLSEYGELESAKVVFIPKS